MSAPMSRILNPGAMPHAVRPLLLSLLLLAPTALGAQRAPAVPIEGVVRTERTLNAGWRFTPGSVEFAEKPLVSDAGWERVTIPHSWNAHDPFDDVPSYDVFDSWGARVGTVKLPPNGRLVGFGRNSAYVVRTDEDDLQYLQRYRLF